MCFTLQLERWFQGFSLSTGSRQEFLRIIGLILVTLYLSACVTTGEKAPVVEPDTTTESPVSEGNWIDDLIVGKSAFEAIGFLEATAKDRNRDEALQLLIRAAELAIGLESITEIDQRLTTLKNRYPDLSYHVPLEILTNRVRLSRKQAPQVLASLNKLSLDTNSQHLVAITELKAQALEQAGFPVDSVRQRIKLDLLLQSDTSKQKSNDHRLWDSLLKVPPADISAQISEIPDTFSGWLELINLTHQHRSSAAQLNQELDKWALRHAQHPANRFILEMVRERQLATSKHPSHIALILPLSGKLSTVGQAIRDGFLATYLETYRAFGTEIKIDIYDTSGKVDLAKNAVIQANQLGAQFIIGPLSKDAVKMAAGKAENKLPILAFNKVPDDIVAEQETTAPATAATVYQFTLAPETEARQAAERASLDGHQYAMVMVPESIWGNRIYEAFATRYQELGGEIIAKQTYKKNSADYSKAIQAGINLNLSKRRHQQLKILLGQAIEFTPRRRNDLDMIFIAASPQEARQIKPQLRFYYADNIPVYATSHIFSGKVQPKLDKDLENIRFCDMPWVLNNKPGDSQLKNIIDSAWPEKSGRLARFYALGADAFRLLPHLEWLKSNNQDWLAGYTGRLFLDGEGVIDRRLSCADFRRGTPVLTSNTILP